MLEGCTPWPEEFVKRYEGAGYWEGRTLGETLDEVAARVGSNEAVAGDDGPRLTYRDVSLLSDRLALHFLELGLKPTDTVLLQLHNTTHFVALYFGLQKAGIIPVPCLPQYRVHELGDFGNLTEAKAYIIPSRLGNFDFSELAQQVRERVPSIRHVFAYGEHMPAGAVSIEQLLADPIEERVPASRLKESRPDPREVAVFFLTGGTTSVPKLVPRTHNDLIYCAKIVAGLACSGEDEVMMSFTPMTHNMALGFGLHPTYLTGGKFIIGSSPDPDRILSLIEKEKVTRTFSVPTLLVRLMNHPDLGKYDLSSFRSVMSGGQKLQPELKPRLEEALNLKLHEGLGMSEGLYVLPSINDPAELRHRTVGSPISPGDEIRIVDEDDRDVPDGEVGELLGRGPSVIRGYFKAPEYNKQVFTSDGFYHTGDLVRKIPGLGLVVEGRRKDIVNRGGEKFSTEEIENLIVTHPGVRDVAVSGMPDKDLGERICAFIVPKPGVSLTLPELSAHLLAKGIAKIKVPERIELMSELPLTNVGKVSKRDLREYIARKLEAE